MVRWAGLEPATVGLENRCSIQLSYHRINYLRNFSEFKIDSLPLCCQIRADMLLFLCEKTIPAGYKV